MTLVGYTIAEEGISKPRVIGEGSKVYNWGRSVIRRVGEVLNNGTKLFVAHNADNSTDNRKAVGEVLGKIVKDVNGKLRTIAIACMTKADALLYDVCSIEAEIIEDGNYVNDIERITGIAVGNSRTEQPAFANAKQMAIVQCFNPTEELREPERQNMEIKIDDLMNVPMDLFKQAIRAKQMHPGQLFELKDLEADREFGSIIKAKTEAEARVTTLETELATTKESYTNLSKEIDSDKAMGLLRGRFPENILDNQKAFIEKNFKPEALADLSNESLDSFIETSKTTFKEYASLFSDKSEDANKSPNQEEVPQGDTSLDEAFATE